MLENEFRSSDIWRIKPDGGPAERITFHSSRVTHPVFVDDRTLLYLATDPDGSGPWLYSLHVNRRIPHRLSWVRDTYTSLAASADGHRLVLTLAHPKGTLWRVPMSGIRASAVEGAAVSLDDGPRYSHRGSDRIASSMCPRREQARASGRSSTGYRPNCGPALVADLGGPEIDRTGRRVAFSVEQQGPTLLYVMNVDGTQARVIASALVAAGVSGLASERRLDYLSALRERLAAPVPDRARRLRVPLGSDYAIDPCMVHGRAIRRLFRAGHRHLFRGECVTPAGAPVRMPKLTLTRGTSRVRFLEQDHALVVARDPRSTRICGCRSRHWSGTTIDASGAGFQHP